MSKIITSHLQPYQKIKTGNGASFYYVNRKCLNKLNVYTLGGDNTFIDLEDVVEVEQTPNPIRQQYIYLQSMLHEFSETSEILEPSALEDTDKQRIHNIGMCYRVGSGLDFLNHILKYTHTKKVTHVDYCVLPMTLHMFNVVIEITERV